MGPTRPESGSFIEHAAHLKQANYQDVSKCLFRSESGTPSLPDDSMDGSGTGGSMSGEFPCHQCDKKFGNRRNLVSHLRRHTGDYKIFCDDCGKGFFTQSKLDSHKRKHTGEKF